MSMMEYKGYYGTVTYDDEAGIFFGRVNNLPKDGITFEGKSVEELRTAFRESIDDYLSWYKEGGATPDKPAVSLKRRTADQYPPSLMSPERRKEISEQLGKELGRQPEPQRHWEAEQVEKPIRGNLVPYVVAVYDQRKARAVKNALKQIREVR